MRFDCSPGGNLQNSRFRCTLGENAVDVTGPGYWLISNDRQLNWRWPNGAECQLMFMPDRTAFNIHEWHVHIDEIRVCTCVSSGSLPSWRLYAEWQCGSCSLFEERLRKKCQMQSVKAVGTGRLMGVWRTCCYTTRGVIRDACDDTLKIVLFAIMLAQRQDWYRYQ